MVVRTNDRLLRACSLEETDRPPVWFMRQAGRYMSEYREIRRKHDMLEICKSPELSSRVSALPVQKFGVDAAILFSDIMIPLTEMGVRLSIVDDVGPVLERPLRTAQDVRGLGELDPSAVSYVPESIKRTRELLGDRVPVIGFSGAPFTLASYLVEGGSSRNYMNVKLMMYNRRDAWDALMQRLARAVATYLLEQADAGCPVVQLFDSWAGALSPADYSEYVLPYTSEIAEKLWSRGIHVISFLTGNSALLPLMKCRGVDVISVDWRIAIDDAWRAIGHDTAIQGNLDPAVMLSDRKHMINRAADILARTEGRRGHIFNLGHGMLKETPEENVRALVDYIHGDGVRS